MRISGEFGLWNLIRDIEAGTVDCVVVYKGGVEESQSSRRRQKESRGQGPGRSQKRENTQ